MGPQSLRSTFLSISCFVLLGFDGAATGCDLPNQPEPTNKCANVDCGPGGTCLQEDGQTIAGQYQCACAVGYEGGGINTACSDIDEYPDQL